MVLLDNLGGTYSNFYMVGKVMTLEESWDTPLLVVGMPVNETETQPLLHRYNSFGYNLVVVTAVGKPLSFRDYVSGR